MHRSKDTIISCENLLWPVPPGSSFVPTHCRLYSTSRGTVNVQFIRPVLWKCFQAVGLSVFLGLASVEMGPGGRFVWSLLAVAAIMAAVAGATRHPHPPHPHPGKPESPKYSVVQKESDFEIRLYEKSAWITAPVDDVSFVIATQAGVHKLFPYVGGANSNHTRLDVTTPVLTGFVPSAGPFSSSAFVVRFYLPSAVADSPPLPPPEVGLKFENWDEKCIAVRFFPGFAKDVNVAKEAARLEASLEKTSWANFTDSVPNDGEDAYTIAQYNPPFQIFGPRRNEVWVTLSSADKCKAEVLSTKVGRVPA